MTEFFKSLLIAFNLFESMSEKFPILKKLSQYKLSKNLTKLFSDKDNFIILVLYIILVLIFFIIYLCTKIYNLECLFLESQTQIAELQSQIIELHSRLNALVQTNELLASQLEESNKSNSKRNKELWLNGLIIINLIKAFFFKK